MSFELILPFFRPIEPLLLDEDVSEIMGNPDSSWSCEREGRLCQEPTISFDAGKLRTGLEVIANQLGKRLDEDNPRLHAQLPDGSRIAAWIPPLVSPAPAIAIRKFTSRNYTVDDLIARGTLTQAIADLLAEQIRSGKTLLISGGTGTGKTTLLRILANSIPENERILVIEDNNSFPPLCGLANTQSSSVGYGLCSRQFHKTLDSRKSSGTGLREASVLQSPTCCITIERMGCCRRFTLSLDKICYQE
jgi:pilus assembly protein CpaF